MPNPFEKVRLKHFAALPFIILTATLFFTIAVTYKFYQDANEKAQAKFESETERLASTIEERLNQSTNLLQGIRGFIESEKALNRQKLDEYIESLELNKNFKSIQGIAYSRVFNSQEGESLNQQLAGEGFTNFNNSSSEERIVHQATIYLNPANSSDETNVKYNIANEPFRRNAFERLKDTGRATATGKILLSRGLAEDKRVGFLIYLPVNKPTEFSKVQGNNRKNLNGFIYVAISADEFLRNIKEKALTKSVGTKIFEGQEKAESLLAESFETEDSIKRFFNGEYQTEKEIDFAGRKWILKFNALSGFTDQSNLGWTSLIFFSGIGFSLLLFGILQQNSNSLLELKKQKQDLLEKERVSRLRAEKANLAKDEFISLVSHELRTPLNAIAGWTKIIKTENLSSDTKVLALSKIEKNLRTQTKLVEELLHYSQIVSGERRFEKEEISFSEVFESVYSEFEPVALEKEIFIYKDNKLVEQRILGDSELMKIVIQNLLTNAIKFTESGGKIEVSVRENLGEVELTIKDDGEGISPDYLPKIFDLFSQGDTSITRNHGGLGLGLAVSNQIIKLHDGKITAQSDGRGKGSTFTVTLPTKKIEIDNV